MHLNTTGRFLPGNFKRNGIFQFFCDCWRYWREFKICQAFEILPIRQNVEQRTTIPTVFPHWSFQKVLEVQIF